MPTGRGDLISRKTLLDAICGRCNRELEDSPCEPAECPFYQEIVNAPAVEAEPVGRGNMREGQQIEKVEINFFDKEEIYENCTVQVLTNTTTGAVSVGWWQNECGAKMDG